MRVILKPTVSLIGHSTFVNESDYEIPDDGDEFVQLGSFAAKACYDSFGKDGRSNETNQRIILEHRHGSVLEHIHISLFIEGITRGLSLELNRHRSFKISQRSTRYVKEEDSSIVLEPYFASLYMKYMPGFRKDIGFFESGHYQSSLSLSNRGKSLSMTEQIELTTLLNHLNSQYYSIQDYQHQVEDLVKLNPNKLEGFDLRKWARGKARNVLPHGIETRGTYTNNVRGWRWFIESRSDRHAEPEIRRLAQEVLMILKSLCPLYFEDFKNNGVYDEIIEWVPEFSKV